MEMEMYGIKLIHGEMLEVMGKLPEHSVDAIITDLPYGTTACKWDTIIPFEPMWDAIKHILRPNGVFITTSSQPFTSSLIMSNIKHFKYELVWDKVGTTGFLDANRKPLKRHENILIFSAKSGTYNPQKVVRGKPRTKGNSKKYETGETVYHTNTTRTSHNNEYFPTSIYECSNASRSNRFHPTQKPVELYEYLIKTYTNDGDTVGDFCFGSGTTVLACLNTGRKFIGCELEKKYFDIAVERVKKAIEEKEQSNGANMA